MSIVSDLIVAINTKITQIAVLISNVANAGEIKAERDEAIAGLQAIDAQLDALLVEKPVDPAN